MLVESVSSLLSLPLVAALIGVLAGAGMALVNGLGIRRMTPDDPYGGYAKALSVLLGTLVAAVLSMFAYRAIAPKAVQWYGLAMVGSLLVVSGIVVWRSGLLKQPAQGGS